MVVILILVSELLLVLYCSVLGELVSSFKCDSTRDIFFVIFFYPLKSIS